MTSEEIEQLIQEVSAQLKGLPEAPGKPLTKQEKRRKLVLEMQMEALDRIKIAKAKGDLTQEVKAGVDYSLLARYGEKHPFMMHFIRTKFGWWQGL